MPISPGPRQVERRQVAQRARAPDREQQSQQAADRREHEALGQQLLHRALARLPPIAVRIAISRPRVVRPGEQEVGHVGAADQQHEAHRAEQHEQGRPDVADDPLGQRHRVGLPAQAARE